MLSILVRLSNFMSVKQGRVLIKFFINENNNQKQKKSYEMKTPIDVKLLQPGAQLGRERGGRPRLPFFKN